MKRVFFLLLLSVFSTSLVHALSYEEARERAWFLTDKMAYELNLTQDQYDRAYEINLDYLMSIQSYKDCSGRYWDYRNTDLRFVLQPWQYTLYASMDYFFRPIRWIRSAWYFPIFDRYRNGRFYFPRPLVYVSYLGGGWLRRGHNAPSPYRDFVFNARPPMRNQYGTVRPPRPAQRPGFSFGDKDHRPGHMNQPATQRPSRPSERPGFSVGNKNERPNNSQRPQRMENGGRKFGQPVSRPTSRPSVSTSTGRKEGQGSSRPTRRTGTGRTFSR